MCTAYISDIAVQKQQMAAVIVSYFVNYCKVDMNEMVRKFLLKREQNSRSFPFLTT